MSRACGFVLFIVAAACSGQPEGSLAGGAESGSLPSGAGGADASDGGSLADGAPSAGGSGAQTDGETGASGANASGEGGQGGDSAGGAGGCTAGTVCGGSTGLNQAGGGASGGGPADAGGTTVDASGEESADAGGTAIDANGGEASEPQRPPPSCVDGDPCTIDRWNGSACEHPAAPDSTPCDDGRICTMDDRCVAGVCAGNAFSSEAALLGQVRAFGGFSESNHDLGLVALLSEQRAVFVDESGRQSELTLVAAEGGEVAPLSSAHSKLGLAALSVSSWLWVNQLIAHVVPLSTERFVFLAGAELEVYDVVDDQLVGRSSGVVPMRQLYGGATAFAAAGRGERLWIGGDYGLLALTISENGEVAPGPEMPSIRDCHALALSPDGATLYVATLDGLHVLAVDGAGAVTESGYLFDGSALFNVRVNDSWLAVQKMVAPVGHGDIDVLRASDLSRVATFPAAVGGRDALGFALTDRGILLERYASRGDSGEGYSAEHYSLTVGTAVLENSFEYRDRRHDGDSAHRELTRPDALGESIALTPVRQIAKLTSTGFSKPFAEHQGSFDAIRNMGQGHVAAIGTYTSQNVDLSTPAKPVSRGLGLLSPAVQPIKLEFDERSGSLHMLSPYPEADALRLPLNAASDEITVLSSDANGVLAPTGSFAIGGGPSHLFTVWGSMFQLSAATKDRFALRRFGCERLAAAIGGAALVPDAQATLAVQADETHEHYVWKFHVDELTGNAVLVDSQQDPGTGRNRTSLTWATLGLDGFSNPLSLAYGRDNYDFVIDVKVFGERAVVLSTDVVSVVSREGNELKLERQLNRDASSSVNPTTLLAFDGDALYLGDDPNSDGTSALVHVLDARDLSERATYQLPEPALAMTNAGNTLAFVSVNHVFTASPHCN